MLKIINLEPSCYSSKAKKILSEFSDLEEFNSDQNKLADVLDKADGAIIRLGFNINKDFLDSAPKLKFIATATTGLNHVDLKECEKRGVKVISLKNDKDFLDTITATAEHTLGLMLALLRKIPNAFSDVKNGKWRRSEFKGTELSGKTIGIIGYGRLGKILASYCKALRMEVLAVDINPTKEETNINYVALEDLLKNSDIISIHLPLDKNTHNFISSSEFSLMKKKPYLINTSRGEIIDEKELIHHLELGHIAGAALDVLCDEVNWSNEIPEDNIIYNYLNNDSDNLIVTPHIGGATNDSMEKTEVYIAKKIRLFCK